MVSTDSLPGEGQFQRACHGGGCPFISSTTEVPFRKQFNITESKLKTAITESKLKTAIAHLNKRALSAVARPLRLRNRTERHR
jgi:hypothetical protein